MSIDMDEAKQKAYADVEGWIKTAQAKLDILQGQAEGKLVKAEVEAYETLMPKLQAIQQKLQEMKSASGKQSKKLKADLERLIADFEKAVKVIESEAKAS